MTLRLVLGVPVLAATQGKDQRAAQYEEASHDPYAYRAMPHNESPSLTLPKGCGTPAVGQVNGKK
ncbi:hypothetical protein MFU01_38830 [Myxococcus fulvus]|uniref:Uncharacterized protein n=1 Tax=Myxococcus fulvus TaxID=33 RepID=A0A511T3U6_MYXFU|nr:hypothetical protein MFU01_38830 [Myxococcus fulvus]